VQLGLDLLPLIACFAEVLLICGLETTVDCPGREHVQVNVVDTKSYTLTRGGQLVWKDGVAVSGAITDDVLDRIWDHIVDVVDNYQKQVPKRQLPPKLAQTAVQWYRSSAIGVVKGESHQ
jgi:hypothetical protein